MKQQTFFDEIFVDNFAGGGGASTGIELATGQPITIAINHDESAIMMHRRNHPWTEHYREDVWMIDPIKACRGRRVRLAWFSPDCKHFSHAKGAALCDKKIRGLAWVVLRWAGLVRPDVIMLENVPEFVTWGPVRKGRPVKSKAGQTYRKWRGQLEALGYKIETRNLCAADYGAPTIRTRFCLVARCDGQPIKFPERTHAPRNSPEVKSGKLKPWRSAAEIIDWSLPCFSIFESKEQIKARYGVHAIRPLADKTLRRIAMGLDKFVLKSAEPFIMSNNENNQPHGMGDPVPTITAGNRNFLVEPTLEPFIVSITHGKDAFRGQSISNPLGTVVQKNEFGLIAPSLIQYHSEKGGQGRGQSVDKPLFTVDGSNRYGLTSAFLTEYFSTGRPRSVKEPMNTLTALDRDNLTVVSLTKFFRGVVGAKMQDPLPTVTAIDHNALQAVHLAHFKGNDKGQTPRDPLMTVTATDGQFAAIQTTIVKWDGKQDLHYWGEVRALLNRFCGYRLADDEILLLAINGAFYFISDVGLRMLSPRELYDAMGFPHDYIIDRDVNGKPIGRAAQVARCGNAVCPVISEALTRANLPECPKKRSDTMRDLHSRMA